MSWPWSELGLPGPAGLPEIRKAYAQRLKTAHPEEDPEGFQRLHAAYQEAGRQARRAARSAGAGPKAPPEGKDGEPAGRDDGQRPEGREGRPLGESRTQERGDDEPLKSREAPQKPPEGQTPGEADWDDGGRLKEESAGTPAVEPPAPEWDFEALFAQGEAEAQAARRRKLEALREKNRDRWAGQERDRRRQAEEDEESWAAVMAAAQILERLHASGAPLPQWRRFLDSPVFLNVRANLDFVFALEDFLEQRPGLSPEIRRLIFLAYEAQNGSRYPAYNRLYRLLNVQRKDRRREARARSRWRNAWRSYPPWRKAGIVVCFGILAVFLLVGWTVNLRSAYRDFTQRRETGRWTETAPRWLEEDYGEPFVHAASEDVFAPAADPDLYFRASPYGERGDGWPGYRTNYPHILVKRALENFAAERDLELELASYTHEIGDAPGAYLLNLPLLGGEEDVAALGDLLEELARQDWHQVPLMNPGGEADGTARGPAEYTVYLCHRGLAFYEASSTGGFDTREALALYGQAGPAFCRYILENSGLADRHLGEGTYVLQDREALEMGNETFFQVSGADKDGGQARVRYLLASGGGMLFCVPEEKMDQVRSIPDLYRGAPRHIQLDKIGLVIVTDQVPEG